MAAYQFACDQFGAPTLPNLWGMTGAEALPWWAWLLLAQLGVLYGLFEYVRRGAAALVTPVVDLADLQQAYENTPAFTAPAKERSKWTPDTHFRDALAYFGVNAAKPGRTMTVEDATRALIVELWTGKVTAWGKAHPTDEALIQVKKSYWDHATVQLKTNYAFSSTEGVGVYNVQLSSAQMEVAWPPKAAPA